MQQLECSAALDAHSPDIVLCSWMPFGVDWTNALRACRTVGIFRQPSAWIFERHQPFFLQSSKAHTCNAGARVHLDWRG